MGFSCDNCGFNQFEETDGIFVCKRCSTRVVGATQEETMATDLHGVLLGKQIMEKKIQGRKEGPPWTTFQAYDLILKEQCKFLVEKLCLPDDVRNEVINLWSIFLEKTQVVMVDGVVDVGASKLPLMSSYRDIALIGCGMKVVPRKSKDDKLMHWGDDDQMDDEDFLDDSQSLKKSCKVKKRQRRGDKIVVEESEFMRPLKPKFKMPSVKRRKIKSREFVPSDSSDDDYIDFHAEDIDIRGSFLDPYNDLSSVFSSSCSSVVKDDEVTTIDAHVEQPLTSRLINSTQNTVSTFEEEPREYKTTEIIGEDSQIGTSFADLNLEDEEEAKLKLMYDQLNDCSKQVCYKVGLNPNKELTQQTNYPSYRQSYIGNPVFRDRMSLTTCIAFIYIALRSLNVDVFVNDLLMYMDLGYLTFYSACKVFPSDWLVLDFELNVFRPTKSITPFGLLARAKELISFLEYKFKSEKCQVDVLSLVGKYLEQLNLPLDLMAVLEESVPKFKNVVQKLGDLDYSSRSKQLQFFECNAIVLIIIALKKAFGLGDEDVNQSSDENDFDFQEWLHYAHIRLVCLKSFVTPLFGVNITEIEDEDIVMQDFFYRIQPRSQIRFGRRPRKELPDIFDRLDYALEGIQDLIDYDIQDKKPEGKSPFFEAKYPSSFLPDYTEFCIEKLEKKGQNDAAYVLKKDFTMKSLVGVMKSSFRRDYQAMSSYNNILLDHTSGGKWMQHCKDMMDTIPAPLTLLLDYASIILQVPQYLLIPEIIRVERMLFPRLFPVKSQVRRRIKRDSTEMPLPY